MTLVMPPWSYSAIEKFENCPKQYYHKYVLKEKEPDSIATRHGSEVHKALENRLRDKKPLPEAYKDYERRAASIDQIADKSELMVEMELAVDKDFKPVGFWDKSVWGRGKADVVVQKGNRMWVGDWKTGKVREKAFQVSVFAGFLFKLFPEVELIHANNIWLQADKLGETYKFARSTSEMAIWAEIINKINRIELAFARENFPPKQSGLCGYCSVHACPFNTSKGA